MKSAELKWFFFSLVSVNGHGAATLPPATFLAGRPTTEYLSEIKGSELFPGYVAYSGPGTPAGNAVIFAALYDAKPQQYTSVKTIVDVKVDGCGNTDPNAAPYDITGLSTFEWQNGEGEGFTPSHTGPCEVWIDDKVVFHDNDCATNFKGIPGVLPIDYSSCVGTCMLTFYWLALHNPDASGGIQLYKNCIPISGKDAIAYKPAGNNNQVSTESAGTTDYPPTTTPTVVPTNNNYSPTPTTKPSPSPSPSPLSLSSPSPSPSSPSIDATCKKVSDGDLAVGVSAVNDANCSSTSPGIVGCRMDGTNCRFCHVNGFARNVQNRDYASCDNNAYDEDEAGEIAETPVSEGAYPAPKSQPAGPHCGEMRKLHLHHPIGTNFNALLALNLFVFWMFLVSETAGAQRMNYWGHNSIPPYARSETICLEEIKEYYHKNGLHLSNAGSTKTGRVVDPPAVVGSGYHVAAEVLDVFHLPHVKVSTILPKDDMNDMESLTAVLKTVIQVIRRQLRPISSTAGCFEAPKKELAMNQGERRTWLRRLHVTPVDELCYTFDRSARFPLQRGKQSASKTKKIPLTKNWAKLQGTQMEHKRQRFEHVLAILEEQQLKEIKREIYVLQNSRLDNVRQHGAVLGHVAKERAASADFIMQILEEYEMVSGVEIAEYCSTTISALKRRFQHQYVVASSTPLHHVTKKNKKRLKKKKSSKMQGQLDDRQVFEKGQLSRLPVQHNKNRTYSTIVYNPMAFME